MKMHLSVPVASYFGVAITRGDRQDRPLYRVSLSHQDPELCVILQEARERASLTDAQRRWAAFFAKPALTAPPAHALAGVITQRPATPTPAAARRMTAEKRRKGWRRCKKVCDRPQTVFRGEREIICYE